MELNVENNSNMGGGDNTNIASLSLMDPKSELFLPDIKHKSRRLSIYIIAFVTSLSFVVVIAFSLLLVLQLTVIGYWAKIFHAINSGMAKTFSWEILIRIYGSSYNDCIDRSGSHPVRLTLPEYCPYQYTTPPIPLIAMTLLIGTTLSAIFCCIEEFFFKESTLSLRALWIFAIMKFIFFMGTVISICLSFSGSNDAENNLKSLMKYDTYVQSSPPHISPRWELTQLTFKCCGIQKFVDWNFTVFEKGGNPLYPRSCCDNTKFSCNFYPNRKEVWQSGCIDSEYAQVKSYAMSAVYLASIGFLSTLLITILSTITHTIYQGKGDFKITFRSKHSKPAEEIDERNSSNTGTLSTDILPKDYLFDREESKLCSSNVFTVNRNTNLYIHVNSWGIHCKLKSSTVTQTHIMKKETLV